MNEIKTTILIADASLAARVNVKKALGAGYRYIEVLSADEAARAIHENHDIAIAIADAAACGFALLGKAAEGGLCSSVPVIIISDGKRSEDEEAAINSGAADYVKKPMIDAVLRLRVRGILCATPSPQADGSHDNQPEQWRRNADTDRVTGISNKEAFYIKTREYIDEDRSRKYALICWNIERFKLINDFYGTETGDSILREMALKVSEISKNGTCGRISGDHFAFLIDKNEYSDEKLTAAAQELNDSAGITQEITSGFGVYFVEDTAMPIDRMCDLASLALASIKGNYMRRIGIYKPEMREQILLEQQVRSEMKDALRNRDFKLYLQPVYSLTSGKPISAEVLVRWVHPVKGVISPGVFIPIFEKSGFITRMDHYVWEEACKYLADRKKRGMDPFPISVNVSRASLYNPSLCDDLSALVGRYGIEPFYLRLEVTETAYGEGQSQLIKAVHELQSAGFMIMMDDFGSGYSSLNTLKDTPVDYLKIDMRFLEAFERSSRAGNILTSVVRMAKWLDLPVIAEGVETQEQIDFLRSIGCDIIQGYYFARPMPIEDFNDYITDRVESAEGHGKNAMISEAETDILMGGNQIVNKLLSSVFGALAFYEFEDDRLELIRFNDTYCEIMHETPSLLMAKSTDMVKYTDSEAERKRLIEACRAAVRDGTVKRLKSHRRLHDGGVVYADLVIRALTESGKRSIICIAFADISKAMDMENELTYAHEQLQTLLERIPSGVALYEYGDKPSIVYANDAFFSVLGHTRDEFNGRVNTVELLPEKYKKPLMQIIENPHILTKTVARQGEVVLPDGTRKVICQATPMLPSPSGNPRVLYILTEVSPDELKKHTI